MSAYPIQRAKVQRPPLRDETLARPRLLDWLHVKVHHRVIHVIAEAGYGKTTLLADFARRTRLSTLWYRLDAEDRSWPAFLSYLVASGREQQERFAPATADLLRELATGGPSLEVALESLIQELEPLGESGAVIILDDFHLVDEAPDVRHIMRALLQRAPERVSFVLASRRVPGLPVARLRALGEVAELHTDDLRFSEAETEQLFRDTYGRPLEADVLSDLSERTEGWAASLQLVNSAIQARSPAEVRSFVRSLSGAEGELYDYLAEEVIGTLAPDVQQFLMRVSLLQELDPTLMETATGLASSEVARLATEGERSGLLVRGSGSPPSHRGIHPLVRQFLHHRLAREIGAAAVRELHLEIARVHYDRWTVACHHFAEANEPEEVHRCLAKSIRSVLGVGPIFIATQFLRRFPPTEWSAELSMIQSRAEYQANRLNLAVKFAEQAFALDATPLAAQNLSSIHMVAGDLRTAVAVARQAAEMGEPVISEILQAGHDILVAGVDGSLARLCDQLEEMAERQRVAGLTHYYGISLLNLAAARKAQGEAGKCLDAALRAEDALMESSSPEVVSARLTRAWAVAHLRTVREALEGIEFEVAIDNLELRVEIISEVASIHIWYGDVGPAVGLLEMAPEAGIRPASEDIIRVAKIELALRNGEIDVARRLIESLEDGLSPEPGHRAHALAVTARAALQQRDSGAHRLLANALALANQQGAWFWFAYAKVAGALLAPTSHEPVRLPQIAHESPGHLSILAELTSEKLHYMDDADVELVRQEAAKRPARWRPALRAAVALGRTPSKWPVAYLLDEIGDESDVVLLRSLARRRGTLPAHRSLGRALARRLAPQVFIEDLGRVRVLVGDRIIEGSTIRRKVLSLLCFLVSKPAFSATRDQVLDALWPDMEPAVAGNSLNQTVYFLRRVIEPHYSEDTSAGYLHFEGNLVWLDPDLVRSRSAECWSVIREMGPDGSPVDVETLSNEYRGRFALDFAYEEWAIPYRDQLHAGYLQLIEQAVVQDVHSGHFQRGAALIRAALAVDPTAENLEVFLVRLYKLSGAHAAAAEQYTHYASVLRNELGVEPPPLDAL